MPKEHQYPETFSLAAGIGGIVLVWVGLAYIPGEDLGWRAQALLVGGVVLGVLLVAYEGWRRLRRTTLVPQRTSIGVYVGDTYRHSFPRTSTTRYVLSTLETIKSMLVAVSVLLIGVPTLAILVRPIVLKVLALRLCVAGAGAIIHTHLRCHHFFIPRRGGGFDKTVLLVRTAAERLFLPET